MAKSVLEWKILKASKDTIGPLRRRLGVRDGGPCLVASSPRKAAQVDEFNPEGRGRQRFSQAPSKGRSTSGKLSIILSRTILARTDLAFSAGTWTCFSTA